MQPKYRESDHREEVLIVEDSPTQVAQLRHLLEEHGYRVTHAANGREALAALQTQQPGVVLTDVVMPEMDGYELCRSIKAHDALKEIPVILLTALCDPKDVIRGLECGADNFITKPYDERDLLSRLEYILSNRELRRHARWDVGVEVFFGGQKYFVNSERRQILDLLLSTYEAAVRKNAELSCVQEQLAALNADLGEQVRQRTAALEAEIAARRQSEERYRGIVESQDELVVRVDPERRFTFANDAFLRKHGFKRWEDLQEKTFESSVQSDDLPLCIEALRALEQPPYRTEFEARTLTAEGVRWIYWENCAIRDPHGRIIEIQAVGRDITERKRTDEQIERLSRFPSENPNPVLRVSAEGVLEYANAAAEALRRVMDAEVGGAVNVEWRARIGAALTKEQPVNIEILAGDRTFFVNLAPMVNRHYVNLYARDITERKKFEESLRDSEERFRLLSKATNDAIWDWNLVTGEVSWNEGYQTLFGYSRKTIEQATESRINRIHPEDHDRVLADLNKVIGAGAQHWSGGYRFRRKDGSYAYVLDRGYVIRDDNGKPVRMIGGMTDLTERKRTEEQLAEQAALLDAAQEAIFVMDLDDQIVFWNNGAERTYGWSRAEAIGRKFIELIVSDKDTNRCREAQAAVLAKGEWHGEMERRAKDGRELVLEVRWTLIRNIRGEPKSILAIGSDITERKRLEAQFLRAQRMESIGTLAGGIAHDLNNILAPILMSVDLLKMSDHTDECAKWISTISSSARRGADLVKQVLSFARGVEGRRVSINLNHVASDIHKLVQETFPKSIVFRLERSTDLWTVEGDPTQLHQVLMNLCVNARDAMPEGGKLTVKLRNVVLDELYSGMNRNSEPGPYVVIEVEDTGTGIPRELQERIFDPFFTTKDVGKGTGLGLSTALTIVKNHRGFIHVVSEPGKNTLFQVHLPAVREAVLPSDRDFEISKPRRGSGQMVLVVDDEANIRTAVQQTLELFGYRVLLAANGAEAVAFYAKHKTDIAVVLTDMTMPVMDGPATIAALKSINPAVKIVASSGKTSDTGAASGMAAGVQHFVPKPYSAESLLRVLDEILRPDH